MLTVCQVSPWHEGHITPNCSMVTRGQLASLTLVTFRCISSIRKTQNQKQKTEYTVPRNANLHKPRGAKLQVLREKALPGWLGCQRSK